MDYSYPSSVDFGKYVYPNWQCEKGPEIFKPEIKITESDISATLEARGLRYGQFKDHAKIAQGIQDVLRDAPNWNKLDPDMKQALSVIADKMARILNGDPNYEDNWHDICGYSTLVERRILAERAK